MCVNNGVCECVQACEDVISIINLTNEKNMKKQKRSEKGDGEETWGRDTCLGSSAFSLLPTSFLCD